MQKIPHGDNERDKLLNKISALRSRMKTKTDQKNSNATIWSLARKANMVAEILENELSVDE